MAEKRDFDKEASGWDTPPRVKAAGDVAQSILSAVNFTSEMDVLDCGCGTGLVTLALAPVVNSVTGIDSSKGMLEALNRKIKNLDIDNVKVGQVDLDGSSVISGQYHVIISSMTFHHVKDIPALLARLAPALRTGGSIAIADLDEESGQFHANNDGVFHFGFKRDQMRGWLEEAGLTDTRCITAARIKRSGPDGGEQEFSVFLMIGRRSG